MEGLRRVSGLPAAVVKVTGGGVSGLEGAMRGMRRVVSEGCLTHFRACRGGMFEPLSVAFCEVPGDIDSVYAVSSFF